MNSMNGKGSWDTLIWLGLLILALWAWVPDYLPADASDVQALGQKSSVDAEARQALVLALKETPNPNRGQLRQMEKRVNEVLVTAAARGVTGDKTLPTPAEAKAMQAKAEAVRESELEAKAWGEMSNEERAQFVVSKWQYVAFTVAMVLAVIFGLRTMSSAQRGY